MIRKARQKLKTGLVLGLREQRLSCLHSCLILTLCHLSQAILCGGCCTEPAALSWRVNCPWVSLGKADEAVFSKKAALRLCAPTPSAPVLLRMDFHSLLKYRGTLQPGYFSALGSVGCRLQQFMWGHSGRGEGLQEHLCVSESMGNLWNGSAWHSCRSWGDKPKIKQSDLTDSACVASFSTWSSTRNTRQLTPEMPTLTKDPWNWIWRTLTSRDYPLK